MLCRSLFVLFLLVIVLSVLRFTASDYSFGIFTRFVIALFVIWFTASDYSFGILWSLCCLSFDLRLLITSLVSFDHCVVCHSIYGFWLLLWYLLIIVLSVIRFTASDYSFGILWSLCYLSFDLRLLITPLVSCGHCVVCLSIYGFWLLLWYLVVIVLSVLRFTASDYSFGILWSLCCLSFDLRLLITPLVSFDHCAFCHSIYGFWLLLWYLLVIVLSVIRFTASDYSFGIFWSLCFLSFDLRLLITPLASFDHCVFCHSIYGFWLLLWYLVVIVLSVIRFTASDYSFGVLWSLCCLPFDLQLLITPLVSCDHCVVCHSIYGFWLLHWYLQTFL
jgi:hypothetical protein